MARTALVTGANRGLGAAVADTLEARGLRVLRAARDGSGDIELDVTDEAGVRAAAAAAGPVDVLVNNAALLLDEGTSPLTVPAVDVERAFAANAVGPWRVCQAFVPGMRERGWGRVVNVSSGAGSFAHGLWTGAPAYAASKAALNALTVMLADELRGTGVLVNAVSPGLVSTRMAPYASTSPAQAAGPVADLATLPDDGPTGGFFSDGAPRAF